MDRFSKIAERARKGELSEEDLAAIVKEIETSGKTINEFDLRTLLYVLKMYGPLKYKDFIEQHMR